MSSIGPYNYYGNNRVMCDVLEEMRKCHETRNYGYLSGLIEEAQSMANRMEAGLSDKYDFQKLNVLIKERKKEIKALDDKIKEKENESTSTQE